METSHRDPPMSSSALQPDWRITTLLKWIDACYTDTHLTVKEFSFQLRLSEKYLGLLFKQQVGTTFHRYLTRLRASSAALQLLETPHRSIKEIAFKTGYPTQTSFDRAFKLIYGMSPKAFRQSHYSTSLELRCPEVAIPATPEIDSATEAARVPQGDGHCRSEAAVSQLPPSTVQVPRHHQSD